MQKGNISAACYVNFASETCKLPVARSERSLSAHCIKWIHHNTPINEMNCPEPTIRGKARQIRDSSTRLHCFDFLRCYLAAQHPWMGAALCPSTSPESMQRLCPVVTPDSATNGPFLVRLYKTDYFLFGEVSLY